MLFLSKSIRLYNFVEYKFYLLMCTNDAHILRKTCGDNNITTFLTNILKIIKHTYFRALVVKSMP